MLGVLRLGDNMVDKYMHIRTMYSGGNALNLAVYVKTFGIEAGYLGVFGDDEVAAHVYDAIRGLGPELSHCRFYSGENGYAEVRLDNGNRVFIGSNKSGVSREHSLELTAMDKAYIAGYDIVHTSTFSYIEGELSLLRQTSSFVSMDFLDRADEEYLRQCTPYADCASISCDDMSRGETEKQMAPIRKLGCRHIVIATRRVKGALVMVDGHFHEQSPCLVEAADTMGAGDSLITCFLINYANAIRDSRDFPAASRAKGTVTVVNHQDLVVRTNLYRVAVYSAGNCQKDGSPGLGKVFQNE